MTPSLRRHALAWMTGLLTIVGLVTVLIAYVYVRNQADELLDGQLRLIALNAGVEPAVANAPPTADEDPNDLFVITIWDAHGELVHRSVAGVDIPRQSQAGFADMNVDGTRWHVYTLRDDKHEVQAAQREEVRAEIIASAAVGVAAPIMIVIPLSWIVVGWAMSRMLRRLDELEAGIAARSTLACEPIPLRGVPSEIAPLVESMNGLIERLRAALDAQKRLLADAAHELRTPLAAMQIQVDNLAAEHDRLPANLASLAAGVKRASALMNQLLRLAHLDEPVPAGRTRVDVGALLLEAVADILPIADHRDVDVGVDIRAKVVSVAVAPEVRTLLGVLIDNSVRYAPSGGSVDVTLSLKGERAAIEILDTGPGLPKGQETRIFDRFFRGAAGTSEGTGLGLAIARRVAERNAFELTVENRADGQAGVCARVVMRVAQERAG